MKKTKFKFAHAPAPDQAALPGREGERMLANPREWRACSLIRHFKSTEWKSK